MGRPRTHDESTAELLLTAAERILESESADAVSIRTLATATATSTRAVYSTFGSKHGLLAALAARAFELLEKGVRALPATDDPAADLITAGLVYRQLVTDHPALVRLAFQERDAPAEQTWPEIRAQQRSALDALRQRVARLLPAGSATSAVDAQTLAFHALCEGLGSVQLRGARIHDAWPGALRTLTLGMAAG